MPFDHPYPEKATVAATSQPRVRRLVVTEKRPDGEPQRSAPPPGSKPGQILTRLEQSGKKRALLLGDAGQGKSTLLRKLALELLAE